VRYLHIGEGERVDYPYAVERVRADNPQVSFPREMPDELLEQYGVYPVMETEKPQATLLEQPEEDTPVFRDGTWRQQWKMMKVPPPESITRRQCALQLLYMGIVTGTEALAMTKSGDVPAAIATALDENFSGDARVIAEINFAAATYYRSNGMLSIMGMTPEQLDEFFIAAAQI
jgi:hypothetical protein